MSWEGSAHPLGTEIPVPHRKNTVGVRIFSY
jgi:hypothetical protein